MVDVTKNRHTFIGGSDVAGILGLSEYRSPLTIWEDKVHPQEVNQAEWGRLARGKALEPIIYERYEDKWDCKFVDRDTRFIHPKHSYLGCHIDSRITGNKKLTDVIVEAKTVDRFAYNKWEKQVPLEYYCQMQHNLFVSGEKRGLFIILAVVNWKFYEFPVYRDDEYLKKQNKILGDWWTNYVVPKVQPPMTLFDVQNAKTDLRDKIVIDNEYADLFNELKRKMSELDVKKNEVEQVKDKIKLFMGKHTLLTNGRDELATYKFINSTKFDTKKFKFDNPELYKQYSKPKQYREFKLKAPKQK